MVGQEGILLDSGTNEVEILELVVNGQSFGINVLKIQQILTYKPERLSRLAGAGRRSWALSSFATRRS